MSDFNINEYIHDLSNQDLIVLYNEFEYLNQKGALPDKSVGREIITKCMKRYGNSYQVNSVILKVYYEMATRFVEANTNDVE